MYFLHKRRISVKVFLFLSAPRTWQSQEGGYLGQRTFFYPRPSTCWLRRAWSWRVVLFRHQFCEPVVFFRVLVARFDTEIECRPQGGVFDGAGAALGGTNVVDGGRDFLVRGLGDALCLFYGTGRPDIAVVGVGEPCGGRGVFALSQVGPGVQGDFDAGIDAEVAVVEDGGRVVGEATRAVHPRGPQPGVLLIAQTPSLLVYQVAQVQQKGVFQRVHVLAYLESVCRIVGDLFVYAAPRARVFEKATRKHCPLASVQREVPRRYHRLDVEFGQKGRLRNALDYSPVRTQGNGVQRCAVGLAPSRSVHDLLDILEMQLKVEFRPG